MSKYLNYAAHLLRGIAGDDLCGRSITLVDQADLPERFQQTDSRITAWTHAALDIALGCQPRGFAAVVNMASVVRRTGDIERRIYGVAIHELAHWLALPEFLTCERHQMCANRLPDFDAYAAWACSHDFRQNRTSQSAEVRKMFAGYDEPAHGHRFLIAGLHLQYRAAKVGIQLSDADCHLCGDQYGTSSAAEFRAALGDSLKNGLNSPIRSLLQLKPTGALLELIERDQESLEYLVLNEEH